MPAGRPFGDISSKMLAQFKRQPATVQEAARALQLTVPAAWPAVRYLESRGHLRRVGQVQGWRGRPSPIYSAAAATAAPHAVNDLAAAFAAMVRGGRPSLIEPAGAEEVGNGDSKGQAVRR